MHNQSQVNRKRKKEDIGTMSSQDQELQSLPLLNKELMKQYWTAFVRRYTMRFQPKVPYARPAIKSCFGRRRPELQRRSADAPHAQRRKRAGMEQQFCPLSFKMYNPNMISTKTNDANLNVQFQFIQSTII